MKSFETERLILKPAEVKDADFFLKLYNMPSFIKYIGDRNLRTKEDAENYINNRFFPQFEKLGFGNYVVILKEDNTKIGAVGIFEREGLDVLDIGFSFLEKYEGKGFAYESANKLKEVAASDFGVHKISAITTKDNYSSQKLIEKLGLKFQKMVTIPNDDEELMYYEN
ncbi:GNAT family N-acetyltransferase [Epilithonimonas mollis]|uniref:Protein N-acetyltransferase, RimJ/RimL family n=1 Tax=Epilithonimonas mollis TaxID=216903 RepID=A0A1M6PTT4_9FLAO|nr:GNAT family N-acetyltransferase [Epilithonimonas mollis]SHK11321.1 Protein N-acetyltransferase, RimJ/RimL family [Epilithonimonas mollis]